MYLASEAIAAENSRNIISIIIIILLFHSCKIPGKLYKNSFTNYTYEVCHKNLILHTFNDQLEEKK